jgi:predicted nucleic acid-binding protein
MNVVYLETSAVLNWLFGEPAAGDVVDRMNRADVLLTSELTRIETVRSIRRASREGLITEDARDELIRLFGDQMSGWFRMNVDESVIDRATRDFPAEPVRSLDAIHLSTALEFRALYPDLYVLTSDKRIAGNCEALGM